MKFPPMPHKPKKLRAGDKFNFNTLLKAASHGDLALVSALRAVGKTPAALICAMSTNEDGTIMPVPLAEMIQGNPFELFDDPTV